jgi:hypothetical protein
MENFILERGPFDPSAKVSGFHAELMAEAPYATIEDTKMNGQGWIASNCTRVYCTQFPTQFNFQIRTTKPITRKGAVRNMIATVGISLEQARAMVKFMEDYADLTKPQAVNV